MSHTMPIDQAAANLAELVRMLKPGDEIVLTEDDRPVARIIPTQPTRTRRRPGSCKGMLIVHQEDDEHLADFNGHARFKS